MSPINSRQKGASGEREAAKLWNRLFGTDVRRSQQFCGRSDESDDIIGQPGVSLEVKRVQNLNIDRTLETTKENAAEGLIPLVLHRKNKTRWKATVYLEDLPQLTQVLFQTLAMKGC